MIENEIKLNLTKKEIKALINRIKLGGARKEFCTKQTTYRLDTKNKDLEKRGVFLRTRAGEKSTFTIKQKITSSRKDIKSRKEIEVDIDGIEKIITINSMLKILGFDYMKIMEKYRMQWEMSGCKIAIDELSFGLYVEIEGDKNKIFKIVKDLGLEKKKAITDTYWDLFEKFKKKNNIKNRDNIKFGTNYNSFLMSL
jgi:adenylate cyclase class IV